MVGCIYVLTRQIAYGAGGGVVTLAVTHPHLSRTHSIAVPNCAHQTEENICQRSITRGKNVPIIIPG